MCAQVGGEAFAIPLVLQSSDRSAMQWINSHCSVMAMW